MYASAALLILPFFCLRPAFSEGTPTNTCLDSSSATALFIAGTLSFAMIFTLTPFLLIINLSKLSGKHRWTTPSAIAVTQRSITIAGSSTYLHGTCARHPRLSDEALAVDRVIPVSSLFFHSSLRVIVNTDVARAARCDSSLCDARNTSRRSAALRDCFQYQIVRNKQLHSHDKQPSPTRTAHRGIQFHVGNVEPVVNSTIWIQHS